jgi:hypothetical protein
MGRGRFFGTLMIAVALLVAGTAAEGAKWSRKYIRKLPDSAFAAIERTPDGKAIRRLPHHDAGGNLDIPHLCNALARLAQVKWRDPANAEAARRHLEEHLEQVGRSSCRPGRKAGDGG